MTGFASHNIQIGNTTYQMDIRSVNNRFLDIGIKLADEFKYLEPLIREKITNTISRGKISMSISCHNSNITATQLKLNQELLTNYLNLAKIIHAQTPNSTHPSIAEIINFPGMLLNDSIDQEKIKLIVASETELLIHDLRQNQEVEGSNIATTLLDKSAQIAKIVATAKQIFPSVIATYHNKLKQKLTDALKDALVDEQRLQQEFVYFCQKIDVVEEFDRLDSHIKQFDALITTGGTVGKKIDFLVQEMHREANTFGAKSISIDTTKLSMELRILIEQIKEQIQNIV